jgi:phasin family protein
MRVHVFHQYFLDGNKVSLYIDELSGTIMFVASQHLMREPFPRSIYLKENTMFSNTQQFSNATKALFENQFASLSALSGNVVESMEKVVALNMAAAKASSEESTAAVKQLLTAKDPQEFFSLVTAQAKLNAEKLQSYNRTLAEIAANSKAELNKVVEAQVSETRDKVTALVSDVTKNAPAGSEQAVAMLKSAIDSANAGYEQLSKSAKQAAVTVEENVAKVTEQFSQAVEKTTSHVAKK